MNIFFLDYEAKKAAQYHCNKHVIKMLVEYAQLLSSCHRLVDGEPQASLIIKSRNGKTTTKTMIRYVHPVPEMESILYKLSHEKHPSALWIRQSKENYLWLFKLYDNLHSEYQYRYGKEKCHGSCKPEMRLALSKAPKNLPSLGRVTWPTHQYQAIAYPELKHDNPVLAYRNYYNMKKISFAEWYRKENGQKVPMTPPTWYTPNQLIA